MMTDCIPLAGLILAVFTAGIAVGKLVEKIERYISEKDNEDHRRKNNRP